MTRRFKVCFDGALTLERKWTGSEAYYTREIKHIKINVFLVLSTVTLCYFRGVPSTEELMWMS
jgi:hypothetical protein